MPGMQIQQRLHSPLLNTLTALGQAAAYRLHQYTPTAAEQPSCSPAEPHHS
jgi:hypothetical protein